MGHVVESLRQWHALIDLEGLLDRYDGLNIVPSSNDTLVIVGDLAFNATDPDGKTIADSYAIRLEVLPSFPDSIPSVWEMSKRISRDYHKLNQNRLCLGAPTRLRMEIVKSASLLNFVDQFVVPYLYGHSHFEQTEQMPFGELAHGAKGIRDYLCDLFQAKSSELPEEFLRLSSLHKRVANKRPCPCDSKRRLGRCHNRVVNRLRLKFGRKWFAEEYTKTKMLLESQSESKSSGN
jgi:hypothetical protein